MKKKFDAVEFQRRIRKTLTEKYTTDRSAYLRELREKYGHLRKKETVIRGE